MIMTEKRIGFEPKIRQNEKAPSIPENKELTGVDGKLVLVTVKTERERCYGSSSYTLRQICEIFHMQQLNG